MRLDKKREFRYSELGLKPANTDRGRDACPHFWSAFKDFEVSSGFWTHVNIAALTF